MADAWVVVEPGAPSERFVPVGVRLHIGRECAGIEPSRRLLLDEPSVSRDHAEIRVESAGAVLIDVSSNGTRVNGRLVERGERTVLRDGDRIAIGTTVLAFRLSGDAAAGDPVRATVQSTAPAESVVLVGDVIGYTTLTEANGAAAVAAATDALFVPVRDLVIAHGGVVNNYAGDAILALWEKSSDSQSATEAVRCAIAAARQVAHSAIALALRTESDEPLRMGWAVTMGSVAASRPSPGRASVHGDAVNLAFRLAGIAGRNNQPDVLVADDTAALVGAAVRFGELQTVSVKGRVAPAAVRPVLDDPR